VSDYPRIHELLERTADQRAGAVALVQGEQRLAYGELESRANRLARLLGERGVVRGDRVGLLADNGPDYVIGFFGILKAGACVVALNSANKPNTLNRLLADSGAVALVTRLAQVRRDLEQIITDCTALRCLVTDRASPTWEVPAGLEIVTGGAVSRLGDGRPGVDVSEQDLAAILYTSGSTGKPRGATLTHRNLAANTHQILAYLELTEQDSVLVVLPFHYSFGKSLLLTHCAVGGRLVIDNRFAYPQAVLETMAREQVSGFSGVPSTYAILCAKTDFLARDWPHLRYLTQAGGAMAPALTLRIRDALPERVRLFVMYGQTEASARLSYLPPERLREKLGSIGIPIPGVSLTVSAPDGSPCAPGEAGEIVAAGDNIMQGYWNDPQETAKVLRDGQLLTGDLARQDEDGFLWIVDRKKNMIKCGAHRVSAKEIEETLAQLPGVVEACVVGVPDALLGEAIEAFVVCTPAAGLGERDVLHHCHQRLALFKLPRKVHFLESLPKSAAGKIVKAELVKAARARPAQ
jgi:long-chain acyl-CoA synthetase